jgi:hypothetical protein
MMGGRIHYTPKFGMIILRRKYKMSEEKRIKARIIHKHKTYAEWYLDVYDESENLRSDPFIPLNGELIIFDPDSSNEEKRFKFGNGITDVINLPFANEITELDSAKIVHG